MIKVVGLKLAIGLKAILATAASEDMVAIKAISRAVILPFSNFPKNIIMPPATIIVDNKAQLTLYSGLAGIKLGPVIKSLIKSGLSRVFACFNSSSRELFEHRVLFIYWLAGNLLFTGIGVSLRAMTA